MPLLPYQREIFPTPKQRAEMFVDLRANFAIDWRGVHGIAHWSRVWTNGRRLAEKRADVDMGVVELFAWLHDSCRWNDYDDPEHGPRAAVRAEEWRGRYFELSDERLEQLVLACAGHTRGLDDASQTVMVCLDSDRLDIGRVGPEPDPRYLCTSSAKRSEVIQWAYRRSCL